MARTAQLGLISWLFLVAWYLSASAQTFSDATPAPESTVAQAPATVSLKVVADEGYRLETVNLYITGCPAGFAQGSSAVTFSEDLFSVDLQAGGCQLPSGRVDLVAVAQQATLESPSVPKVNTFNWSFTIGGNGAEAPASVQFSNAQPAKGAQISSGRPTISVKIVSSVAGISIRPSSLEVLLSACPGLVFKVGAGATYTESVLALNLAQTNCNLPKGPVTVTVNAATTSGAEQSFSWSFTVGDAPPTGGDDTGTGLLLGDVNGDGKITEQDVALVEAFLRPKKGQPEATLTPAQKKAADLRRPCGSVTPKDLKLLRRAAKLAAREKTMPAVECYKDKRVGERVEPGETPTARALAIGEVVHVQVYMLSGVKVLDDEIFAPFRNLSQAMALRNSLLAPGVYLAVVTVQRLDGTFVRRVEKLVVRR